MLTHCIPSTTRVQRAGLQETATPVELQRALNSTGRAGAEAPWQSQSEVQSPGKAMALARSGLHQRHLSTGHMTKARSTFQLEAQKLALQDQWQLAGWPANPDVEPPELQRRQRNIGRAGQNCKLGRTDAACHRCGCIRGTRTYRTSRHGFGSRVESMARSELRQLGSHRHSQGQHQRAC